MVQITEHTDLSKLGNTCQEIELQILVCTFQHTIEGFQGLLVGLVQLLILQRLEQRLVIFIDEYDDEAGLAIGRTKADSPEIDGKCYVETLTPYKPGDFVKVRITGSEEDDLVGTPEDEVQTS